MDNIYYLRALDPDNDETWTGGSFVTVNSIEHQSTDTTVVSAKGTFYSAAYLALGTTDSNATCMIIPSWPIPPATDLSTLYNQTYTPAYYTQGTTNTGDYVIGLVVKVPHLATVDSAADSVWRTTSYYAKHPANSVSFTFFYSFSSAATDSAIKALHQTTNPITLGITNANNNDVVKVYPNPSKDIINITGLNETDKVSLYDMLGRVVNLNWTVAYDGMNTFRYGNVPSGAYILLVSDEQGNVKSRTPVRKM